MNYLRQLRAMTSGQGRWVGREDLHVYCLAPCDLVPMPTGRMGWQRRQPVYKLRTGGSTGSVWDGCPEAVDCGWTTAEAVVREIESILAKEVRHVA